MGVVPLVETTRGMAPESAVVENVHYGAIAVVDRAGKLLWHAGDPNYLTFSRSTLKPFQALPFVLDGGPAHFGFGARELALMCASHSGEDSHLAIVASILEKAGCGPEHLQCGSHAPLWYGATKCSPAPACRWGVLHNNCSGKHGGFLAYCSLHGLPHAGYLDPAHALQQRIRATVAEAAGLAEHHLRAGVDGCSAPNYAMPLAHLAQLYARLAQGGRDTRYGSALGDLFGAMTSHPHLVSGTARHDLAYMETGMGDWVAKGGADGVQAVGIRSAGLGIAVKISDGNARAMHVAVIATLQQLGLIYQNEAARLELWRQPAIKNARGIETGEVRATFLLQKM